MLFNKKNKTNPEDFRKSRSEIIDLLSKAFSVINTEQLKVMSYSKSTLSDKDIELYENIKKAHEELKTLYTEYEVLFNSTKFFIPNEKISVFRRKINNILNIIKVEVPDSSNKSSAKTFAAKTSEELYKEYINS